MLLPDRRLPGIVRALQWVVCVCFGYVVLVPVGNNHVLLPALALLGLSALAVGILARRELAGELRLMLIGIAVVGAYGSLIGVGNPGVTNGALVWLVAPLLWGLFVWANDERLLRMVLVTSAWMTILSSVYVIAFIVGALHLTPQIIPTSFALLTNTRFFDDGGGTSITFYGITSFAGSAPLWITAAMLPAHPLLPRRWVAIVAGALAFIATVIAGRAAIIVLVATVPVGAWIVWRIISRRRQRSRLQQAVPLAVAAVAAVGVLALVISGNRSFSVAIGRLFSVFTGQNQSVDDAIRAHESDMLIQAWTKSPIFGHGFGAVIPGYHRNGERPWNFELQYHLILFQVGIVGALLAAAVLAVGILAVVRAFRKEVGWAPVFLATLSGAASILIANASNPYLQPPGQMWPIFLPLAVANVALVRSRRKLREPSDAKLLAN